MKIKEQLKELRKLDKAGLVEQLRSSEQELMNLRFKHAAAQLTHTAQFELIRKRVARIRTLLSEIRLMSESEQTVN